MTPWSPARGWGAAQGDAPSVSSVADAGLAMFFADRAANH